MEKKFNSKLSQGFAKTPRGSKIMSYIKNGTKVYYLTEVNEEDMKKELSEGQFEKIKKLMRQYLLSLNYNINLSMQFGDNLIFGDGDIPEEIKEELKQEKVHHI